MSTRSLWLVVAALGCGQTSETVTITQRAESVPSSASCKTEPPIGVQLTSRALSAGRYELTMTATPTKSVGAVELALVLPPGATLDRPERASFGATADGEVRSLVAIVDISDPQRPSDLSAIARVPFEGISMSRAATVTLGAPRIAPRTKQYALPDGERAREVRP